ncbi:MAG: hypothetical protein IKK21_03935, partial [Clostridia bacterium]|nr:hypothetical protein [Clostridia bacterium]
MAQLMIVLAAMLLIVLLALIARPSRQTGTPAVPEGATLHEKLRHLALHTRTVGMTHLKPERRLISAMQQLSRNRRVPEASAIVSAHLRTLALLQHRVQKELRTSPLLPSDQHGDARMMLLCMALIESSDCVTPRQLLEGLSVWEQASATTLHERQMLPVCMRLTLTRLLADVIKDIRQDVRDIADGERLARRLHRSRQPGKLASRIRRSPAFLYGLFS